MKKLIALLLALVMVLALTACGGAKDDALHIQFTTTFQETATGGELVTYFKNNLEEATKGAIVVDVFYGGTVATDADALNVVSTGAMNMTALGHNPHATNIPLLCGVPDFAPNSVQNALDYFTYLLEGNAESAAALEAEAAANGVKYLGALAGGANAFVANFDFNNLTELLATSRAFGNMEAAKFQALGFSSVEAVLPWDLYTSFDTGLIDATQMASTSMLQDGVAEVTTTWMYDNTYTAGNFMTVNLEWWNGLTADQQEAIQAAVDATAAYSVEVYEAALESEAATLTEMGIKIAEMTDAEFEQWWSVIMDSKVSDTMTKAAQGGFEAEAEAVLSAAAEFTSYAVTAEDMAAAAEAGLAAAEAANAASAEPAAEGEASPEPKMDSTGEYEITVDGVTGIAQYADTDNGDQATKGFVITWQGVEMTGAIDKGVWTADDAANQAVIDAVKAAFEAPSGEASKEPTE